MTEFQPMSPSERKVMRVSMGKPETLVDYHRTTAEIIPLSESTVKTLIIRLTKKGYIQIDNRKKPFHYSATILEKSNSTKRRMHFLNKYATNKWKFTHTLINKGTLSQDDIQELVNALKEKSCHRSYHSCVQLLTGNVIVTTITNIKKLLLTAIMTLNNRFFLF